MNMKNNRVSKRDQERDNWKSRSAEKEQVDQVFEKDSEKSGSKFHSISSILVTHTHSSQSASMSIADANAKNLAYINSKDWTPCPKKFHRKKKGCRKQSRSILTKLTQDSENSEDTTQNVTPSVITSEKDFYFTRNRATIISSERFRSLSRNNPTRTIKDMSSAMYLRQPINPSFNRSQTFSNQNESIRSFLVAISSVTKAVDLNQSALNDNGKGKQKFSPREKIFNSTSSQSFTNKESCSFAHKSPSTSPNNKLSPRISTSDTKPRSSGLTLSAFRRPENSVRLTDCPEDCCIHQNYIINRVLGYGASSTVRLATRRSDGKQFAVKCIPKYAILREKQRLSEIALLSALDHPNIVALTDVFETESEVQLVMEYCPGGELFNAVSDKSSISQKNHNTIDKTSFSHQGYSERDAAKIISSLLRALRYLHFLGIVHRDIKPENILLMSTKSGETDVKLSDFGTARALHPQSLPIIMDTRKFGPFLPGKEYERTHTRRSRAYSCVGSDFYTAPEVHSGKGYDTSADLYSVGVTMYIMLFGRFPTMPLDSSSTSDQQWDQISSKAKELLRSLLNRDPSQRKTAADALKHDWIVQNNSVENKRLYTTISKEEDKRTRKKSRVMDMDHVNLAFFGESDIYSSNDDLVMLEEREDDDGSRELLLRPICYV